MDSILGWKLLGPLALATCLSSSAMPCPSCPCTCHPKLGQSPAGSVLSCSFTHTVSSAWNGLPALAPHLTNSTFLFHLLGIPMHCLLLSFPIRLGTPRGKVLGCVQDGISSVNVFVFQGCCNRSPQPWLLKKTEMYSLTLLEPSSSTSVSLGQNQSVGRTVLSLEALRESLFFQLLVAVLALGGRGGL